MSGTRKWNVEQEINLFSLVCDFKPAGQDKEQNISKIINRLNEHLNDDEKFTEEQVWAKLRQYFDLEKVDEIEGDDPDESTLSRKDDRSRTGSRAKSQESSTKEYATQESGNEVNDTEHFKSGQLLLGEGEIAKAETTGDFKSPNGFKEEPETNSSELSDVDGEEKEIEKLEEKETTPPPKPKAKRGRPKKIKPVPAEDSIMKDTSTKETTTTSPKKRNRLIKDDEDESAPKRRQSAALSARRKTRSGNTPDVELSSANEPNDSKQHSEKTPSEPQESLAHSEEKTDTEKSLNDTETTMEATKEERTTEEPKTRRSTRQAVRRSTRNK